MADLRFDPNIVAARRYKGGLTEKDIRERSRSSKIYKLSSNESPLGPSPAVIECIQQHAATLGRYSPVSDERLRVALAEAYGRALSPGHFVCGNGAFEVLEMIARGFIRPGESCIISSPTFGVYARTAGIEGARIVDVPLHRPDFNHDIDGILAAVDETTQLVYVCNPNNPSGAIMSAADMDALIKGMPEHVLIIADEVYHQFVARTDFPDSLPYVQEGRNLLIVRSFSKAYGMAGMRVGYAIASPEIAGYLACLQRTFHLNTLALEAAIVALGDQEHVERTVQLIRKERAWVSQQLSRLGVEVWPTETNFLLFRCALPAQELFERLLTYGVIIRPTEMFGLPGCLRMTIGDREANQAFVDALAEILGGE